MCIFFLLFSSCFLGEKHAFTAKKINKIKCFYRVKNSTHTSHWACELKTVKIHADTQRVALLILQTGCFISLMRDSQWGCSSWKEMGKEKVCTQLRTSKLKKEKKKRWHCTFFSPVEAFIQVWSPLSSRNLPKNILREDKTVMKKETTQNKHKYNHDALRRVEKIPGPAHPPPPIWDMIGWWTVRTESRCHWGVGLRQPVELCFLQTGHDGLRSSQVDTAAGAS